MKALTLWQPWATLVAIGAKTVETRGWSTDYRGPLAIHAGKTDRGGVLTPAIDTLNRAGYQENPACRLPAGPHRWAPLPLGRIVAVATLEDVVPTDSLPGAEAVAGVLLRGWARVPGGVVVGRDQLPLGDFSPGRYAWLLSHVQELEEPIEATGRQGLWEWGR